MQYGSPACGSQVDDLTACGCDKIFIDKASGTLAARPELDKALAYLPGGDVFVITRLSRAMRSLKAVPELVPQHAFHVTARSRPRSGDLRQPRPPGVRTAFRPLEPGP